jgi:hypothetical protein
MTPRGRHMWKLMMDDDVGREPDESQRLDGGSATVTALGLLAQRPCWSRSPPRLLRPGRPASTDRPVATPGRAKRRDSHSLRL